MKLALLLSLFLITACESHDPAAFTWSLEDGSIIGGKELTAQDSVARYVVATFNPDGNKVCTGVLIRDNAILTAAHCVNNKPEALKIAFGVAPLTGRYVSRKATSVIPYSPNGSGNNHDIALVIFSGGLPPGFKTAREAPSKFPLKESYQFTAIGYGRTAGHTPSSSEDTQGLARLRSNTLTVQSLTTDGFHFIIKQAPTAGVCSGDSGGPALMRFRGHDYVVGILSAVVWSGELKDGNTCADRARYMRVSGYSDWIQKTLKQLQ